MDDPQCKHFLEVLKISPETVVGYETSFSGNFPNPAEWVLNEKDQIVEFSPAQAFLFLTKCDPIKPADKEIRDQLLLTFPGFCPPTILLALFLVLFYKSGKQARYLDLISHWHEIGSFEFSPTMNSVFDEFQKSLLPHSELGSHAKSPLKRMQTTQLIIGAKMELPSGDPLAWTLYIIPPAELARQLTLYESQMFRDLYIPDFLQLIFIGENHTLRDFLDHFNRIYRIVTISIISPTEKHQRASNYIHWLLTAQALADYHNYSGFFAVITGIQHPAVSSLTKTIAKAIKIMKDKGARQKALFALADPFNNFRAYRHAYKNASPPCIPYYGILLKYISVAKGPESELIPMSRVQAAMNLMKIMRTPAFYSFSPHVRIQEMIKNCPPPCDTQTLMAIAAKLAVQ